MKTGLRISILFLIFISCHAKEIPNCNFEDTVDLTNAEKLTDGSYLYENNILVPRDQVDIYDYEELYNGDRVPLPPHPRGCACKERSCIRFCCHPTKEEVVEETRECKTLTEAASYDPYINVMLANGTVQKRNATKEFTVQQGAPCKFNVVITHKRGSATDWAMYENGSIALYGVTPENQQRLVINKKYVCMTPINGTDSHMELAPVLCPLPNNITVNERITYITMAVSIPFLILTLTVYACIVELQNLHGKCFMSYLASLTVGCIILCLFNLSSAELSMKIISTNWCQFVGYFGYFVFMCVFFWLNVISFDLWQSFRRTAAVRSAQSKRFLYYSVYAWGVPLCLTATVIGIDNSNVNRNFKPGVLAVCWIDYNKWSAMIYYFGISLTIVIVDLTFFAMTMYKITTMKKDINEILTRGGSKNNKSQQDEHSFGLFFRLFLIMGLTWSFDTAAYIEMKLHPGFHNPLYYVTDVLNALVGPLIFIFFILNRKVLGLLKKRYNRIRSIVTRSIKREEETAMNVKDDQLSSSTRRN